MPRIPLSAILFHVSGVNWQSFLILTELDFPDLRATVQLLGALPLWMLRGTVKGSPFFPPPVATTRCREIASPPKYRGETLALHDLLDYYAPWPPLLFTALILRIASLPVFRALSNPPTIDTDARRIHTIDGVRGYLALAVVFHHAAILRQFLQRGTYQPETWGPPPSRFYALIGPAGVSMFFMITGYLFWSRLIKYQGKPDWYTLYIGRVFRIGPLYLVAVGVATILDHFARFNYMARVSGSSTSFIKALSSAGLLGLSVYPDGDRLLAGTTWSIQYEWIFYASLPLLALIFVAPRIQTWFFLTMLAACFFTRVSYYHVPAGTRTPPMMAALFLVGILCACAQKAQIKIDLPDWLSSLLILILLTAVFAFHDIYTPLPVLLLGSVFYLIVSGCTMCGLLTIYPAIRLGDVSYGIYLLQGLILSLCFRPAICRALALSSSAGYWMLTLVAVVALFLLSTVTYRVVERPWIEAGRRVAKILRSYRSVS